MADIETVPAAASKPPRAKKHALAPRFNFPLTDDRQRIATDKMQDATREQLRALLADPELPAKLKIDTPLLALSETRPAAPEPFSPDLAAALWGAVSMVIIAAARAHGLTEPQAAVLGFSPEDAELLSGPTCRVMEKYFPAGLGKYDAELMLGVTLLSIGKAKYEAYSAIRSADVRPFPHAQQQSAVQ